MKIKVFCGVGSCQKEQTIDLLEEWGITDEDWREYSDSLKDGIVSDLASSFIEIGYEELDD